MIAASRLSALMTVKVVGSIREELLISVNATATQGVHYSAKSLVPEGTADASSRLSPIKEVTCSFKIRPMS